MKKKFLAILLVFVLFLSACGNKASDNSKDTKKDENKKEEVVTIQMLVPGYDQGYLKEQFTYAIGRFEKENPNIKVEVISAGWEELNSKVVQLYQAKKAPDIMLLGSRSLRQFSENGILEDMSSMMTDEQKADYIENVLDTGKVGGKQFGIPMALSSRGLFYRSDLIKEVPKNWDELLNVAKENTKGNMKGFAIPTDLTSGTDEILNFIYQNGGKIVDEKGNFVINSKENVETLEFFKKLADYVPDPVSTTRNDQSKMFVNNDLAMYISGGWEKETMDKGKDKTPYKVAMLPEGKQKGVTIVTDSYTMSSISEHKKEAFEFIKFMGKLENQKIITAAYGWFPILHKEAEDPKYADDFNKPMRDIMEFGTPEPQVPNWDDFNKSFTIAVQKAMTGQLSPQEALDNCQKELAK